MDLVPGILEVGNCQLGSPKAGKHQSDVGKAGIHYAEAQEADNRWWVIEGAGIP